MALGGTEFLASSELILPAAKPRRCCWTPKKRRSRKPLVARALKKKKRRGKVAGASAPKRPRLLDSIFDSGTLQSKGDSEDDMNEKEHREEPPTRQSSTASAPIAEAPIAVRRAPALRRATRTRGTMPPLPKLSHDPPRRLQRHPLQARPPRQTSRKKLSRLRRLVTTVEASLQVMLQRRPLSPPRVRAQALRTIAASTSSAKLIPMRWPRRLGAKLIGGQVVGSLCFESRE